jgi:flagellar hook-associated protein 1 FlgK
LFSTLNTANSGLAAAQRAMEVTGQNVANVNTDGYSRQRVELQSVGGSPVPAMYSVSNQVGSGVDSNTVIRIRDAFLEAQAQNSHASVTDLTVQSNTLSQVEGAFGEPGTSGIQSKMSNFWAGFGDIASNATEDGARTQLLERAQTLASALHSTMGSFDASWSQSRDSVQTLLTDVNATSTQIAGLNQSIMSATQANLPTNELQDKRDALVLHLAEQVGATATQMDDGTLNVVVGGTAIVSGNNSIQLALTGAHTASDATTDPVSIVSTPGNAQIRVGGTAAGQLTTMNSIIPGYETQLNGVAQQLADQVNGVLTGGSAYDLYGKPGVALLDDGSGGTSAVTAANINVAITDPKSLAMASLSPTGAGGTLNPDGSYTKVSSDSDVADQLYQLRLGVPQADGSYADGADSTYRKMIVALGVQSATVSDNLTTRSVISTQVDASRESTSGVNIDEEMTNMLQFQHAYSAAGQVVSTIQSMMDTLINMVGR